MDNLHVKRIKIVGHRNISIINTILKQGRYKLRHGYNPLLRARSLMPNRAWKVPYRF
jgi:hypothetical protein